VDEPSIIGQYPILLAEGSLGYKIELNPPQLGTGYSFCASMPVFNKLAILDHGSLDMNPDRNV